MERRSQSLYDVCSEARIAEERNAMKQFIAKFADQVDGILCGFDRLVMRGELRALYIANGGGIEQYFRSSGFRSEAVYRKVCGPGRRYFVRVRPTGDAGRIARAVHRQRRGNRTVL